MNKIVKKFDWHSCDTLDGVPLKNGEKLLIKFPNGDTLKKEINIDLQTRDVIEQGGHRSTTSEKSAFIYTTFKGFTTKIYIVGLEAKRI